MRILFILTKKYQRQIWKEIEENNNHVIQLTKKLNDKNLIEKYKNFK